MSAWIATLRFLAAKWCWNSRHVCEQVKRGQWESRSSVAAPLRGHAPLRSLAEGKASVNIASSSAARHRGAEEELGKRYFFIAYQF